MVKEELISEIKELNPRQSCGSDDIGAKVIQLCPMIFADNLAKICNHTIEICDYQSAASLINESFSGSHPNHSTLIFLLLMHVIGVIASVI